jgi:hypothetical protein
MNKQKLLMQGLYLASYSPSPGTEVRIGYFGTSISTAISLIALSDWV